MVAVQSKIPSQNSAYYFLNKAELEGTRCESHKGGAVYGHAICHNPFLFRGQRPDPGSLPGAAAEPFGFGPRGRRLTYETN